MIINFILKGEDMMKKSISVLCLSMIILGSSTMIGQSVGASELQENQQATVKNNITELKVDSYVGEWEQDYLDPNPVKAWKNRDTNQVEIHGNSLYSVAGIVFESHLDIVGKQTGKSYYSKSAGILEQIPSVDIILDNKDIIDDELEVSLYADWQGNGPIERSYASATIHMQ